LANALQRSCTDVIMLPTAVVLATQQMW